MALVRGLRQIASAHGIALHACCEDAVLMEGVEKAHCVDLELLRPIRPGLPDALKRKPTREECGCVESVDIGAYDTCRFGCIYCYATNSHAAARERARTHDPNASALWRP
jgi:sulfatase maturation enzyme AslB (radical SAM superfamily)